MSHAPQVPAREAAAGPFGPRAAGTRLRALGALLGLAAIAVAVYLIGRSAGLQGTAPGHDHGAAPVADSAKPVSLNEIDQRRIGITFAAVEHSPLERLVRTVAQVAYDETRVKRVVLRFEGYVEQLYVNTIGQPVEQGQPLFAIYSPMLVTTQQELLLARRLTEQVEGGTADAVQGAASLLESARTRLLHWEVPPGVVAEVLRTGQVQRTVLMRSPVSGVVVQRSVLAGQRLMPGEIAYEIVDLSRVWIEGEVFEPDLPSVRVGQLVTAEFPAMPGEARSGRISYVYPTLNPETRTARVRVEMANRDLHLKPGMYATFRFSARTEPVVNVPRSAVLVTGERSVVFLRDPGGTLTPREVTRGRTTDDRVEILSGLRPGETVVAAATFLVDAESNLGSALSGMAGMPGMETNARPPQEGPDHSHVVPRPTTPAGTPAGMADMPGMTHGGDTARPE